MSAPLFDPRDFVEYWAAGRVHLGGGDPYDPAAVLPLQRLASGWADQPAATMLWTPPWTLPLYWPFAAVPAGPGHAAWVLVQLACVFGSVGLLWRAYGGSTTWAGWLTAFLGAATFAPVWWTVMFGQNTGLPLLGLAGFLYFRGRDRPLTAGAFAALTAIKPHVLALFGVALVLDGLTRRGWRSLLAGAAVLAGLGLVALLPNPGVYGEFAAALGKPMSADIVPVSRWQVPTPSFRLRCWLADDLLGGRYGELFWMQFVPVLAGAAGVAAYWWKRRAAWDWRTETPRLAFASVLLAPYGTWIFDLTVLLVPVVQAAAAARGVMGLAAAAGLLTASVLTMHPHLVAQLHDTIWFAPAAFGVWLLARPAR